VTSRGIEVGKQFASLAVESGLTAAQLALLWVKEQPGITAPIFGVRTLEQLEQVLPITEMKLSNELRVACDELVPPGTAVVDFHNTSGWMKTQIV